MPPDLYDALFEPANPRERVHRVASRAGISPDIADDYLRTTKVESGHNINVRNSSKGAIGFGQVMPDVKGGTTRTVNGRSFNLQDPDQNIEAGLRYFAEGGSDPVGRRLHYFGGPRARRRYERTGKIPNISDGNLTATQYVQATGGQQQKQQPKSPYDALFSDPGQTPAVDLELSRQRQQHQKEQPTAPAPTRSVPYDALFSADAQTAPADTAAVDQTPTANGKGMSQRDALIEMARVEWNIQNARAAQNADPELARKLLEEPARATAADVVKWARNQASFANKALNRAAFANMGRETKGSFAFTPHPDENWRNLKKRAQEHGIDAEQVRREVTNRLQLQKTPEAYSAQSPEGVTQYRTRLPKDDVLRIDNTTQREVEQRIAEAERQRRVAETGWGEYLGQVPKSAVTGFTDSAATGLKSIAVLAKKIDDVTGLGSYRQEGFRDRDGNLVTKGRKMSTDELGTYQLGQIIQDLPRDRGLLGPLASNPDLEREISVGQSPQAIGQVLSFMLGGWATKSPKIAIALLGAGMTAGDAYDEVKAAGGTDEDAVNAGLLAGALLGPTELIGMRGAMHAITDRTAKSTWRSALKEALREGRRDMVENALQEMGQEIGQGLITGQGRSLEEVLQAGLMGAVGSTVTVPMSVIANRPMRRARPLQESVDVEDRPTEAPIAERRAEQSTVSESPSAIHAQIEAMTNQRGNRMGVLIPKGQSAPTKIPKGYVATRTDEGVVIHPKELSSEDVRELVNEGNSWQLLGHANPDSAEATRVVVARATVEGPEGIQPGTELLSSYVIPGQEQNAIEEMRAQFAPYEPTFEVGGAETAARVAASSVDQPVHHSNLQKRRKRGARKGQFAPGKVEASPVAPEVSATVAQAELPPVTETPEPAEGKLFATEPITQEAPPAETAPEAVRGLQEQVARDLEAEKTKLIQEATKTLSREQFSAKGDPVSTESVLQRQVDRANDLRLEILRRVEDPNARETLEKEHPAFTADTVRTALGTEAPVGPTTETPEDAAPPAPARKSSSGRPKLNPTVDSLETAIRSLGGVRDDGSGEVKSLRQSGKAGVVTAEGRSAEDMAMALAELGYGRDVWWGGSLRQGDSTFTGVNANDFIAAAIEDASGSKRHYSNQVEMDVSAEEEKYWRSQMEPKELEQWEASQKFLRSRKAQRLLREVADGKSTRKKLRELRELGKRYGLEEDVVNEHIRLAQGGVAESTVERDRAIPDTAREATGDEGRPLTPTTEEADLTSLRAREAELQAKRRKLIDAFQRAEDKINRPGSRAPGESDEEYREYLRTKEAVLEAQRAENAEWGALQAKIRELERSEKRTGEYVDEGGTLRSENGEPLFSRGGKRNESSEGPFLPRFSVNGNRIKLENKEAVNLLQFAYRLLGDKSRTEGTIAGVFEDNPARLLRAAETLRQKKYPGAAEFEAVLKGANKAGQGKIILASDDATLTHERFHESSAAADRYLQDRHADFSVFESDPAFPVIRSALVNLGYRDEVHVLVEEGAAYIASGEYQRLGVRRAQAITFLQKWFESFIAHNGEVSVERFREMAEDGQAALQRAIEAWKKAQSERVDESISGVQEGRESGTGEGRAPPTESEAFKRWFGDSKVVDEDGKPLVVYSGHGNMELYGEHFDPKRSGGAGAFYATESTKIASNYADTKLGGQGEFHENGSQYRFKLKNGKWGKKLWQMELTPEQQEIAREFVNSRGEEGEQVYDVEQYWRDNARYDADARRALARGGVRDLQSVWHFLESMGDNIAYPADDKVDAEGNRPPYYQRQRKNTFELLLDRLGIEWQSADWAQPGVFPVYLRIRNPIDAEKPFPPDLLRELRRAASRERSKMADPYDAKWTADYPLKQWVQEIEEGYEYWSTQVPKKAIPIIKSFGYDGIKEVGMKGETDRSKRQINWIAFEPTQIKSATGNRGTFDPENPSILMARSESDYQGEHAPADAESGAPLHNLTANEIYPADVYGYDGQRLYSSGYDALDAQAHSLVQQMRNKPNARVTIYRAIPAGIKGNITKGDWVTPFRGYAKEHGESQLDGKFKIIKKAVHARDLFTDGNSWLEWGYDPQPVDVVALRASRLRRLRRNLERVRSGEKIVMINKYPNDRYYGKEQEFIEKAESELSEGPLFSRRPKDVEEKQKGTALDRLRAFAESRGQNIREFKPREQPPRPAPPSTAKPEPKRHVAGERSFPKSAEAAGYQGGTDRDYSVLTNKESLDRAEKEISRVGADRAAADLAHTEDVGAPEIATGILLMQHYERKGDISRAVNVASDVARKLTQAGQTVQAASLISRLSPEGVLLHAQKLLKGQPLAEETAKILVQQAKAVTDAEKLLTEIQKQRPDIFGPSGEILPKPSESRTAGPRSARARIGTLQDRLVLLEQQARERMQARAATAKAKTAKMPEKDQRGAAVSPASVAADLSDLVIIGAAKLARKGITRAVWLAEMAKEAGTLGRRDLRKLYRQSYEMYERERKQFLRESRERGAVRHATKAGEPAPATADDYDRVIAVRLEAQKAAQRAHRELARTYQDLTRGKLQKIADTAVGLRRANLLTAVKTHLRNITSNVGFTIISEETARPMTALADMVARRTKGTGMRTTGGLSIPAASKALYAAAVKEGPRRAVDIILGREVLPLEGYRAGETTASKMQLNEADSGFKILDLYINTVFHTLEAEDALFKVYAFRRELADIALSQARREHAQNPAIGIRARAKELQANPTDAMQIEAAAYADYATFQNKNVVSSGISAFKSFTEPVGGKFLIEQLAPFDRTPTNIIARALENSPLGLISATRKYRRIGTGAQTVAGAVAKEAFTRQEQKDFARTFGRASTGTMIAALAMILAAKGLLSGAADYDDDREDYMKKRRQYGGGGMLRVPGTNQRISIMDTPVGKSMATAAAMYEHLKNPENSWEQAITKSGRAALNAYLLDQPLIRGLRDLGETKSVGEAAAQYGTTFVPGSQMLKHVAEVVDEEPRRYRGQGAAAQFKTLIPGRYGRGSLPIDSAIDREERGRLGRRALRALDPFNTTTEGRGPKKRSKALTGDWPMRSEMERLGITINDPERIKPGKYESFAEETTAEYEARRQAEEAAIKVELRNLENQDYFKGLSAQEREAEIRAAIKVGRASVRPDTPAGKRQLEAQP